MSPSSTSNSERPSRERLDGLAIAVVALFLLLLAGHAVVDAFFPVPPPELFGIEARRDRRLRATAQWHDGSRARLVEHGLRLTSRMRRTSGPWYSLLLFRYFGQTTERGLAGRGGWVYIRNRAVLPNSPGAEHVERTTARLAALERRLALLGTRLVVVPVPRKAALYPDPLPRGIDPRPELDALLTRSLERRGVTAADLGAAWERRMEPGELVYFQTDSHWTDTAQLWAAEEAARAAGALVPVARRQSRVASLGTVPQERDTLDFLGLHLPERAFDFLDLAEVPVYGLARPAEGGDEILEQHRNSAERPRQALLGTSFSAHRRFPLFLEHFTQHSVWNAAGAGDRPLEHAVELLEKHSDDPLETLFLEVPNHQTLTQRSLEGIDEAFVRVPPPVGKPTFVLHEIPVRQRWAETFGGRFELGRLASGELAHSGDGIAELAVRGRIEGEEVELVIVVDGVETRLAWPDGQREIMFPLTTARPGAGEVTVALEGTGRVFVERLAIVAHSDRAAALRGRRGQLQAHGEGWRQSVSFAAPGAPAPSISDHDGLFLTLGNSLAPTACELIVRAGNQKLRYDVTALAGAKMILSLDPLSGRTLRRVELECPGSVPRRGVDRALLLPPSSPH